MVNEKYLAFLNGARMAVCELPQRIETDAFYALLAKCLRNEYRMTETESVEIVTDWVKFFNERNPVSPTG